MDNVSHHFTLAACYARGALERPDLDDGSAVASAVAANVRLHRFKRSATLPRVRVALGALRGFSPSRILDIGSGRGVFLWTLLDAMPGAKVTAVDLRADRVRELRCLQKGGWPGFACARMDATALGLADSAFDIVTILEVLEHLPHPGSAAAEAMRVARCAVVFSVPSGVDDNPEHLHVLDPSRLEAMFRAGGARRLSFTYVPGHVVGVAVR